MIFFGTGSSRLKDGRLNGVNCPNCNEQTSMTYSVFGKYAQIYWIPIFPTGKTNVLECDNCKRTYKLKELPEQIKHKFDLEKHSGVPLKHFSGVAIIGAIFAWISYTGYRKKQLAGDYIKTPQIGDIYRLEGSTSSRYTTAKVVSIKQDSIYLISNDYEVDRKSGISEIDINANYNSNYTEGYTLEELQQLYADDFIYQIDRD